MAGIITPTSIFWMVGHRFGAITGAKTALDFTQEYEYTFEGIMYEKLSLNFKIS